MPLEQDKGAKSALWGRLTHTPAADLDEWVAVGQGRTASVDPSDTLMTESTPQPVYANVVNITLGAFDIVLDFGFKTPEQTQKGSPDYELVARVAMSLGHAKSMLPLLARLVAEYESKVGPITAPGYDAQARE
jgi:hypothetical protein